MIGRSDPSTVHPSNGWLALGPGGAYFVQKDPQTLEDRLLQIRADGGRVVERARAFRFRLLDAGESLVLSAEQQPNDPAAIVTLRTPDGRRDIPLPSLPRFPLDATIPTQLIDSGRAVIETESDIRVVAPNDDQEYATLLPGRSIEAPVLRWPFLAYNAGQQLTVWNVEDSWRQSQMSTRSTLTFRHVGLMEDAWVGLLGSNPIRGPLPGSEPPGWEVLDERPCFSAHTDGRRAVFACDPEPATAPPPLLQGHTLLVYDGRETKVYGTGEDLATLPRISGRWVAYLAYPPGTTFCEPARGEVVVRELESAERHVVASVTHGCLCCDAYWPPPTLVFENDLLAWSYDLPPDAPEPERSTRVALARVGPPCN